MSGSLATSDGDSVFDFRSHKWSLASRPLKSQRYIHTPILRMQERKTLISGYLDGDLIPVNLAFDLTSGAAVTVHAFTISTRAFQAPPQR